MQRPLMKVISFFESAVIASVAKLMPSLFSYLWLNFWSSDPDSPAGMERADAMVDHYLDCWFRVSSFR